MWRRESLREYVSGSLWVMPGLAMLAAIAAGMVMSQVQVGRHSR